MLISGRSLTNGSAQTTASVSSTPLAESPPPDGEKEESWENWKRDISFKRGVAFPVTSLFSFTSLSRRKRSRVSRHFFFLLYVSVASEMDSLRDKLLDPATQPLSPALRRQLLLRLLPLRVLLACDVHSCMARVRAQPRRTPPREDKEELAARPQNGVEAEADLVESIG